MLDASIFRDQMTVRRLRLGAGLIMLCYPTLHFCMHALGNVSFEAMQWGTQIHDFVWHSVPGTIALYGAFAVHFTLALYALYPRRSFRMGTGPRKTAMMRKSAAVMVSANIRKQSALICVKSIAI
jgi:adenylate cyclase